MIIIIKNIKFLLIIIDYNSQYFFLKENYMKKLIFSFVLVYGVFMTNLFANSIEKYNTKAYYISPLAIDSGECAKICWVLLHYGHGVDFNLCMNECMMGAF